MKKSKSHKASIVNALRCKGFSKNSASNIARATLEKSQRKPDGHAVNWKESIRGERVAVSKSQEKINRLHEQAAINIPSSMAGKVVVF